MIVPEHRILMIHIPRTGGSSIEYAILASFPQLFKLGHPSCYYNDRCPPAYRDYCLDGRQHKPLDYFKDRKDYAGLFKFAFVRDPYDILISHFRFTQLYAHPTSRYRDFNHLIDWLDSGRDPAVFSSQNPDHLQTQTHFIGDGGGLDFLGRYERLIEGYAELADHLGLGVKRLARVHSTSASAWVGSHDLLTPHLDFINAYYTADFEAFGYETKNPS